MEKVKKYIWNIKVDGDSNHTEDDFFPIIEALLGKLNNFKDATVIITRTKNNQK